MNIGGGICIYQILILNKCHVNLFEGVFYLLFQLLMKVGSLGSTVLG